MNIIQVANRFKMYLATEIGKGILWEARFWEYRSRKGGREDNRDGDSPRGK